MTIESKSTITVKEWFYEKVEDEMARYHWFMVGTYNTVDGHDELDRTKIRVEEVLKETEKAVQVVVDTCTYNFDTVANGYKLWIPKSVIV